MSLTSLWKLKNDAATAKMQRRHVSFFSHPDEPNHPWALFLCRIDGDEAEELLKRSEPVKGFMEKVDCEACLERWRMFAMTHKELAQKLNKELSEIGAGKWTINWEDDES